MLTPCDWWFSRWLIDGVSSRGNEGALVTGVGACVIGSGIGGGRAAVSGWVGSVTPCDWWLSRWLIDEVHVSSRRIGGAFVTAAGIIGSAIGGDILGGRAAVSGWVDSLTSCGWFSRWLIGGLPVVGSGQRVLEPMPLPDVALRFSSGARDLESSVASSRGLLEARPFRITWDASQLSE